MPRQPLTDLAELRGNVRVEMLRLGASLGLDGKPLENVPTIDEVLAGTGTAYAQGIAVLRELATLYVGVGGDLELAPQHDPDADYKPLLDACAGLADAAKDLTADDFPPRVAGIVDPVNDVVRILLEAGRWPR